MAKALLDSGDLSEAFAMWQKSNALEKTLWQQEIDIVSDTTKFRLQLASSLRSSGRLEEAFNLFSDAVRIDPSNKKAKQCLLPPTTNLEILDAEILEMKE